MKLTDWRNHPWKDEIVVRRVGDAVNVQCKDGMSGGMSDPWFYEIAEFDFHNRWTIVQYSWIAAGHWYMVFVPVTEKPSEFKPFQPEKSIEERIDISKEAIRQMNDKEALKRRIEESERCSACGEITRERYRQMKALNRRRWKQIQELEKQVDYLEGSNMDDRGNIGTLASFEKDYEDQLVKKGVPKAKHADLIQEKLQKLVEVKDGQLASLLNMSRNERRLWFKTQKKKG